MAIVTGYDFFGRAIPTETQTTGALSAREQSRLSNDANAVAGFVPYRNAEVSSPFKDDVQKPIDNARAAATTKANLYGTAGPIAGTLNPGVNPLHNFATFNYNISLHALSGDEFNDIANNNFVPNNPLMHSSGGYRPRNPFFNEDFYIDNFEMISVIGASEDNGTGSKNEVYYTWKIIEPMGMTLMNRIVALGDSLYGGMPWPEIPYCVVIEFMGFLDDGSQRTLHEHRKVLPCKIMNLDIVPSFKGTEYNVKAVPYNAMAFSKEFGTLKQGIEIEAKTLEDAFRAQKEAGVNVDNRPINAQEVLGGEKETAYQSRTIVTAYNNYEKELVKNEVQGVADKITVIFADEILKDQDVIPKETQQADRAPTPDKGRKKVAGKQKTGANPGGPKPTVGVFSFAAGDYIEMIINVMMQQSKFWRKQMAVFTKDNQKTTPPAGETKAWLIMPKIKLLKYDKIRGRPGYDVTFFVKVNVKYNREDPNLPKAWPKNVARIYEYSYSGRNQDVITWDVKFNTAYTQTQLVYPEKDTAVSGPTPSADQSDKLQAQKAAVIGGVSVAEAGAGAGEGPNNEVNPRRIVPRSNTAAATGANANKDAVAKIAANSFDAMYNKLAELNAVNITIVGDPTFIMQEDNVGFSPADVNKPSKEYNGDGGGSGEAARVTYTDGDVHIRLLWKTVTDLNEETGGYGNGNSMVAPVLNGVYKLTVVKSKFENGVFTQQITAVRLVEQEEKEFQSQSALLGLNARDITQFPTSTLGNTIPIQTEVKTDYKEAIAFQPQTGVLSNIDRGIPTDGLREAQSSFQVVGLSGQAAFGQRYDIPNSIANPAVDPFNLPTGVVIDPATGLPNYQGNFYTGGQKDIAAWKAAVDAKQPFAYTSTLPNGNAAITRYQGT